MRFWSLPSSSFSSTRRALSNLFGLTSSGRSFSGWFMAKLSTCWSQLGAAARSLGSRPGCATAERCAWRRSRSRRPPGARQWPTPPREVAGISAQLDLTHPLGQHSQRPAQQPRHARAGVFVARQQLRRQRHTHLGPTRHVGATAALPLVVVGHPLLAAATNLIPKATRRSFQSPTTKWTVPKKGLGRLLLADSRPWAGGCGTGRPSLWV